MANRNLHIQATTKSLNPETYLILGTVSIGLCAPTVSIEEDRDSTVETYSASPEFWRIPASRARPPAINASKNHEIPLQPHIHPLRYDQRQAKAH
jgi:hypothetical protein